MTGQRCQAETGRSDFRRDTPQPRVLTTADTMWNPPPGYPNRYIEVVSKDGDERYPVLSAAWKVIRSLLADGQAHTRGECMAAVPDVKPQVVRTLLYFAHGLDVVNTVGRPRQVEVAPDVFMVRTVNAYRLAEPEAGAHGR